MYMHFFADNTLSKLEKEKIKRDFPGKEEELLDVIEMNLQKLCEMLRMKEVDKKRNKE